MVAKKKSKGGSKTSDKAPKSKPDLETAETEAPPAEATEKKKRANNGPRKMVPHYAGLAQRALNQYHVIADNSVTWPEPFQEAIKAIVSAFSDFGAVVGEMDPEFIAPRRSRGAKAPLSNGEVVRISDRALENYEGMFVASDLFTVAAVSPNGKMVHAQTDAGSTVMFPRLHVVRAAEIDQPVGEEEEGKEIEDALDETGT